MSSTNYVLQCQALTKIYQQGEEELAVLQAVDFSVMPGQRSAIIGSSGSGKSTLLNLLAGLDKPSSGDVKINQQSILGLNDNDLSQVRNQALGFVYQFHHLLPEFSALENVAMPGLIASEHKLAFEKATMWLETVGLSHRLKHKPAELSGGERQRVAIARALVNNPSCVIMDEPTGALDAQNSANIIEVIHRVADESKAGFIIATHDKDVAASMQSIYQLANGTLSRDESN